jgi:hypothetical protein
MRDCALIRFFKMLKKLEILPKLVSRGGSNVSAFGWDKNNRPLTIPRGWDAAATASGARACYGPPRQSRTSRSSLFRERARATSLRLWAWRPEMRLSARRAGWGSNSAAASAAREHARRSRVDLNGRVLLTLGPAPTAPTAPSLAIPGSSRWRGGRRGRLAKSRLARCDGYGSRTFANSPVAGRLAIREAGSSPIPVLRLPRASPIAPAIVAWRIARLRRGRARASGKGSGQSPVPGGRPEGLATSAGTCRSGLAHRRRFRAGLTRTGSGGAACRPRGRSPRRRRGCGRTASSAQA